MPRNRAYARSNLHKPWKFLTKENIKVRENHSVRVYEFVVFTHVFFMFS